MLRSSVLSEPILSEKQRKEQLIDENWKQVEVNDLAKEEEERLKKGDDDQAILSAQSARWLDMKKQSLVEQRSQEDLWKANRDREADIKEQECSSRF